MIICALSALVIVTIPHRLAVKLKNIRYEESWLQLRILNTIQLGCWSDDTPRLIVPYEIANIYALYVVHHKNILYLFHPCRAYLTCYFPWYWSVAIILKFDPLKLIKVLVNTIRLVSDPERRFFDSTLRSPPSERLRGPTRHASSFYHFHTNSQ